MKPTFRKTCKECGRRFFSQKERGRVCATCNHENRLNALEATVFKAMKVFEPNVEDVPTE